MTTSTASTEPRNTKFLAPSLSQSKKVALVVSLQSFSNQIRSEPPWMAWHRPSGWLANLTPDWMLTTNLHSFYNDNLEDMLPQTQENPLSSNYRLSTEEVQSTSHLYLQQSTLFFVYWCLFLCNEIMLICEGSGAKKNQTTSVEKHPLLSRQQTNLPLRSRSILIRLCLNNL
jgi:hypothetical protein